MNIAVYVQSAYKNYEQLCDILDEHIKKYTNSPVLLLPDGKDGEGKQLAIKYADERKIPKKVYETDWSVLSKNGKHIGGAVSDWNLLKQSHRAICLWNGLSTGCELFLKQADRLERPVDLVRIDISSKSFEQKKAEDEQKAMEMQAAAAEQQDAQQGADVGGGVGADGGLQGGNAPIPPDIGGSVGIPTDVGVQGEIPQDGSIPQEGEIPSDMTVDANGQQVQTNIGAVPQNSNDTQNGELPPEAQQAIDQGTLQPIGPTGDATAEAPAKAGGQQTPQEQEQQQQ